MRFYFWQNMPAMHQVPYQRELARMGHEVTLCVDRLMLEERAAMGWQPEDTTGLSVHVLADWQHAKRLLEASPPGSIHFVSGVRGVNHGGEITRLAHRLGRRVCWIGETWDHRGAKGVARSLLYKLEALRHRHCVEKVFAMGDLGARDYVRAGYKKEQVIPFNYVVPHEAQPRSERPADAPFVLGYVGALIPRKRVDLLIHALALISLEKGDVLLEIHGDGPQSAELRDLATRLGVESRIRWQGKFPSSEAMSRIRRLDALVLPSDFDGWGAVVNEALLCGVPVAVSDACGAACLPARHGWGAVFRAGDANACAQACMSIMKSPPVVSTDAVEAAIGAKATAQRLLGQITHG